MAEHEDCSESESDDNCPMVKNTRGAHFIWTQWRKTEITDHLRKFKGCSLIYNRLEDNYHLANKKALFMNISNYYRNLGCDPFDVAIPLTFHIKSVNDGEY